MSAILVEQASRTFLSVMAGASLRSCVLALLCSVLVCLFRRKPAQVRHLLWRCLLIALVMLPILEMSEPPIRRIARVHSGVRIVHVPRVPYDTVVTPQPRRPVLLGVISTARGWLEFPQLAILLAIYGSVTVVLLARLAIGILRLKKIARRSEFIPDIELHEMTHEVWLASFAVRKPRIRSSSEIAIPIAIELGEPLVLLPAGWRSWQQNKLRTVLMHEMAHLGRGDPATTLLANMAFCFFWFHPLAWLLRSRLAVLAEEACDEITMRTFSDAEDYARILIDFAAAIATSGRRVLAGANGVVSRSQIKERLERIFAFDKDEHRTYARTRALLVAIFLPMLYLSAARFEDAQTDNEALSPIQRGIGTSEQAAQLEAELAKDPENLKVRRTLMSYYFNDRQGTPFTTHLLWAIEHHPESQLAMLGFYPMLDRVHTAPPNEALVGPAWERALANNPNSADVLFNAGLWIGQSDPERALALYRQARELSPSDPGTEDRYTYRIALVYSAGVVADLNHGFCVGLNRTGMTRELAARLRSEMETSSDPALLSGAGKQLVVMADTPGQDERSQVGLQLLQRAIDLDPANLQWRENLDYAQAESVRRENLRRIHQMSGISDRCRRPTRRLASSASN